MQEMSEPIHGSGRVVTHDNCFCVMADILALHNAGVVGQALIKEWERCCPIGVPGDQIDDHDFANTSISETDTPTDGKVFLIH